MVLTSTPPFDQEVFGRVKARATIDGVQLDLLPSGVCLEALGSGVAKDNPFQHVLRLENLDKCLQPAKLFGKELQARL